MSLRTMERILISSSLILGLSAAGCGDGDDITTDASAPMDSGAKDAGGTDAEKDTGGDEEELPTTSCGSNVCTGAMVSNTIVDPCCVPDSAGKDTSQCGLDAADIKRANPSSPFTGCVPKDVPKASDSTYCGEFWDLVEPEGRANGGLDIKSGSVLLTFEGCCLPSGECGAMITTPRGQDPDIVNSHLGCVSFTRLSVALNGEDAGMMEQPARLPYCNAMTGAPLMGTQTVPGQPKFVCGCGEGKTDDHKGTFPCFNNLPTTVCGADQPSAQILATVPEFICGCPADPTKARLPCLMNVPETTCGTKQIDANSTELSEIPVFICGAGTTPSALPTLKGVDPSVCGKKAVPADSPYLAAVPAFICGEQGNPDTSSLPKLRNLPATTCGALPITATTPELQGVPEFLCGCPANPKFNCLRNTATEICGKTSIDDTSPYLQEIPEFICGCGSTTADPGTSLPCLSYVETTVCGKKPITADSSELTQVPEFICGAEGAQPNGIPQLKNVESTICGTKPITADSVELDAIPVFVCGAENTQPNGLPQLHGVDTAICGKKLITQESAELDDIPVFICGEVGAPNIGVPRLRNLSAAICGELPVASGSPYLAQIPEFLCGCTDRIDPKLGCLRNLAKSVCGGLPITASHPYLANIPKFVCGCGPTTLDTELGSLCMGNVETNVCGTRADAITDRGTAGPSAEDCLTGVPEYAVGCGSSPTPGCLINTPQLPGCDNVTTGPILRVSEILCGCGESSIYGGTGIPCLNFVAPTLCGAVPIPSEAVLQGAWSTLRETVCGCGDATLNTTPLQSLPCVPNVPTDFCGAVAAGIHPTNGPGNTPCVVAYPSSMEGCGTSTVDPEYPIQCIPNVATGVFGCP